jgi:hypothetical protein
LDADLKLFDYRKKRTIFGRRPTQRLFKRDDTICEKLAKTKLDEQESNNSEVDESSDSHSEEDDSNVEKGSWQDKIIIGSDSAWKSYFDVFILVMVGYSCFTTLFYVAFQSPNNRLHLVWDQAVEIFFYTDFCFNFLQEYIDQDSHQKVRDIKMIAPHYLKGWFFVDFVSIFPFDVIFSTGVVTKLVRLARLPRLIKLIDISRFSKILKSFE